MNAVPQPVLPRFYEPILRGIQKRLSGQITVPFEIRLWGDKVYRFGNGAPAVDIVVQDRRGLLALSQLDELSICEAYMDGSLDVVGDMLPFVSLRGTLSDNHPLLNVWRLLAPWLIGRVAVNRQAIAAHYEFANEFYLKFLDATRCYSQAVFECDKDSLESAQRRKLDFALEACRLQPGDRVLDVGCGWGSFTEHAGLRGIKVTSLTISRQSEAYVKELIHRLRIPAEVHYQDFFAHRSPEPYDAIAILGVMEHLPDYPTVLKSLHRLLKPGGRIYLDASAFHEKYVKAAFISRYVFPGDHSYFCLHDFLTEVARTPLDVVEVHNDRHNYFLTCRAWAENLETARDEIIRRWGDALYRRFRLYLWGSAYAFLSRSMQAYRVVLERPL